MKFESNCPYCGTENSQVTSVENVEELPGENYLLICFDCLNMGMVAVSPEGGKFVRETESEELLELMRDTDLKPCFNSIKKMRLERAEVRPVSMNGGKRAL